MVPPSRFEGIDMEHSLLTLRRQRHMRGWLVLLELTVRLCSYRPIPHMQVIATRTSALATISTELRIHLRSGCTDR